MAILDHWHPVLISTALKDKPVGVRLAGAELVLFRSKDGRIGALDDCCVHRRMRLSKGKVIGCRIQCTYHGWTFDCHGAGESPGTPKMHAQARCYDAVERHGAIWVKPAEVTADFPPFDVAGYFPLGTLQHQVKAPLEVTVDNFCEIEHTPTTHAVFGYQLERMHEVQVQFEPTESTVRVVNSGPSKQLPAWQRLLLGIKPDFLFMDDWTTHFSPVYSIYDHWWQHPVSGQESKVRWRLFIFFVPRNAQETAILTFAFTKSRWPGPAGGVRLFKKLLLDNLDQEIRLDVNLLENLASQDPGLDGMKLSRFDRVLGLNRERIERIYRGQPRLSIAA